jgi:hypothetical protein
MRLILTKRALIFLIVCSLCCNTAIAQRAPGDSSTILPRLANKFAAQISRKTDTYYRRITDKTEKTLERLARFEGKVKSLLLKANPAAAARLFDNQPSFADVLAKYREGKAIAMQYGRQYDEYRDKLKSTMGYLASPPASRKIGTGSLPPERGVAEMGGEKVQETSPPASRKIGTGSLPGGEKGVAEIGAMNEAKEGAKRVLAVKEKLQRLDSLVSNTEAVQQFIKERKQQLISQAIQYIGKSKWLQKINKESYYFYETLKNYRSIFEDERKAETTALAILNKIPAWREFIRKNSVLASLFAVPGGGGAQSLAGLQTRQSVQNLIQQQFGSGPNAMAALRDNVQNAQSQLTQLKDKVLKGGGSSSDELPDFKPNNQKSKTFLQRLEIGTNLQHQRGNSFLPVTSDIGLSVGYKLNDRSVAGVGISGKVGWGRNIQSIRITGEGASARTFFNWKLKDKGSFWLSGGAELNYQARFYSTAILNNFSNWQQSALIGVMKKYSVGKKVKGSISILYDALYNVQAPARQPVVFRVGYSLK